MPAYFHVIQPLPAAKNTISIPKTQTKKRTLPSTSIASRSTLPTVRFVADADSVVGSL